MPPRPHILVVNGRKVRQPVFIIGALCILQFLVLLNLARKIGIRYPGGSPEGSFSPLDLVVFLTGPALLLAAGMFLVFMHCRTAAVLFACCVVWRVGALVAGPAADPIDYLGPALMSGFLAYSLWIAARTRHVAGLGERAATRP